MTKATGKRALRKRREDLFWGELRLTRVALHLMQSLGQRHAGVLRPRSGGGWEEAAACDACEIVHARLAAIHREMAELVQAI